MSLLNHREPSKLDRAAANVGLSTQDYLYQAARDTVKLWLEREATARGLTVAQFVDYIIQEYRENKLWLADDGGVQGSLF